MGKFVSWFLAGLGCLFVGLIVFVVFVRIEFWQEVGGTEDHPFTSAMKGLGWEAKHSSADAVRIATQRLLGQEIVGDAVGHR